MAEAVKEEAIERPNHALPRQHGPAEFIELSSSDDDYDSGVEDVLIRKRARVSAVGSEKRRRSGGAELPSGFLDPIAPDHVRHVAVGTTAARVVGSKQFWKAGDYEGSDAVDVSTSIGLGMDHVRVHPKFLHSNATSHKWALGAFAELLDNALDEVCNGATFVKMDVLNNGKDGTRMLLIEDNGGGMNPDKMRKCISLGYSAKSKIANTIGQYGNGFKTSTMRLGADVIVFSRSLGNDGSRTQSIGLLSYTFLRNTGKEDIVVPMLDYEKVGQVWQKMTRSSAVDWNTNVETIIQWSPYSSEADLLKQFNSMDNHGTRIIIYNLWEDDQGDLELDFDTDILDIQVGGVNRDEKKIQMATEFPNSRHFLTYRHSLRSYASILYLRLPRGFRMILRGKDIEHHNIVNDMMLKEKNTYRPTGSDGVSKDPDMVAVVTMGFVKDAKDHIDVQGFNVYHKNRLIKPFWRVWNASGSDGRGVIGVLEANFVEPAHDKQGFERTTVLSRLETKLIQMQKNYWSTNCHKIGYAPRRNKRILESEEMDRSPEDPSIPSSVPSSDGATPASRPKESTKFGYKEKYFSHSNKTGNPSVSPFGSARLGDNGSGDNGIGNLPPSRENGNKSTGNLEKAVRSLQSRLRRSFGESDSDTEYLPRRKEWGGSKVMWKSFQADSANPTSSSPYSVNTDAGANPTSDVGSDQFATTSRAQMKVASGPYNGNGFIHEESRIKKLKDENETLRIRIMKIEESMQQELQREREKNKSLTEQLETVGKRLEDATKEQEALVDIFSDERSRRDKEEVNLKKKLKDASRMIEELTEKLNASRNNH